MRMRRGIFVIMQFCYEFCCVIMCQDILVGYEKDQRANGSYVSGSDKEARHYQGSCCYISGIRANNCEFCLVNSCEFLVNLILFRVVVIHQY